MKTRLPSFASTALTLAAFLIAAAPARAETVDDRIKALEQELIELKEQQLEMTTATEGAAALPTFSYRSGTGRAGSGTVFNWDDRELPGIGIPSRIGKFEFRVSLIAEGDDSTQSNADHQGFNIYGSIQPFSGIRSNWIRGLTFEYRSSFCSHDNGAAPNRCDRYRVQDHGDGGRQTLFDSGDGSIGDGLHIAHGPGVVWAVGPYTLRAMGSFQRSEDRDGTRGRKKGQNFLIGHDIYVWSPKGFLTGSARTPGSVLFGTHFERVDMSLGCNGSSGIACPGTGLLAEFHRTRIILREWDLWYVIAPRMNVGMNFLWYDASNLRVGRNQAAHNLGVCKNDGACRVGTGGDWLDVMFNWRYKF